LDPSDRTLKCCGLVVLLVILVGLNGTAILSFWGFAWTGSGLEDAACASVQMLNATLSGQASPHFIGTVPLLDAFWRLNQSLRSDSDLMEGVDAIVSRTENISRAVAMASQTFQLLKDTMSDPANLQPRHATTNDTLFHQCRFCADIPLLLDPALSALNAGAGAALAGARETVARRLAPVERERLQRSIQSSAAPLVEVKRHLQEALGHFSKGGNYSIVQEHIHGRKLWTVAVRLVAICLAFLLFGCSCSSWLLFTCVKESCAVEDIPATKRSPSCAHGGNYKEEDEKSFAGRVTGCAFCSCCAGFFYVVFAWLAGGFILATTVPMSSACLAIDGLKGQDFREAAPGLGIDLTGDQGAVASGFIDQCLNPAGSSADGDVLRVVFAREDGQPVAMHQRLVVEVAGPLNSSFDKMRRSLRSASPLELAGHPDVLRLREWLRTAQADALLIADEPTLRGTAPFKDLSLDTRGSDGLQVGFDTSAACPDFNVSTASALGTTSLSGVVPGIQTFVGKLRDFGPEIQGPGCARIVACSSRMSLSARRACAAGNAYVELKRKLLASGSFRCNLFQFPNGSTCDPKSMRQNGDIWSEDCLDINGTARVKELPCTLAEFKQYVRDYDGRLRNVLERLDRTALDARSNVGSDMQRLVQEHVLEPLDGAMDGAACGFLADRYREMVDALCYQSVFGFWVVGWSYVACGVVGALLTVFNYHIWLHASAYRRTLSSGKYTGEVENERPKVRHVDFDLDLDDLEGATPRDKVMFYSNFGGGDHHKDLKVPR